MKLIKLGGAFTVRSMKGSLPVLMWVCFSEWRKLIGSFVVLKGSSERSSNGFCTFEFLILLCCVGISWKNKRTLHATAIKPLSLTVKGKLFYWAQNDNETSCVNTCLVLLIEGGPCADASTSNRWKGEGVNIQMVNGSKDNPAGSGVCLSLHITDNCVFCHFTFDARAAGDGEYHRPWWMWLYEAASLPLSLSGCYK